MPKKKKLNLLLEMSCMLLAQTQMLNEQIMELAREEELSDMRVIVRRMRDKEGA